MGTRLNTNPFNRLWSPYSDLLHPLNLSPNTMYVKLRVYGVLEGLQFSQLLDPIINRDYFLFWTSIANWRSYPYQWTKNSALLWFSSSNFYIFVHCPTAVGQLQIFSIYGPHSAWPILDNQNTNPLGMAYGGSCRIIVPDTHIAWEGCDYAER